MKQSIRSVRASHVNSGTSIPAGELPWPETRGRVFRLPKTHVEIDDSSEVTPYGGLDLAVAFFRRFKVAERLDSHVSVLKRHLPYSESDHLLTQVLNLYVGGTCIEDQANLQHSEAVRRILGACRIPDPTTSGDFLRRFDPAQNSDALVGLQRAVDEIQDVVWRRLRGRRGKASIAVVDIDTHCKELYGVQKEGADFSHDGKWSYRPLVFTLAEIGDCLAIQLRPGNTKDPVGVPELIRELTPRLKRHFVDVLYRADSAFDDTPVRKACEEVGAFYAFVGRGRDNRTKAADAVPEDCWRNFRTRARRQKARKRVKKGFRGRRKGVNLRRKRAQERQFIELRLEGQDLSEGPLVMGGKTVEGARLVYRRQLIHKHKGQELLFPENRYRYVVTNLPRSRYPTERVVDLTYERCDQENVIEQMGSGLAVWRMPVAEYAGNAAWLQIARLAWNLAKWIAQLALPEEAVRWEWKRFRQSFVYVAAKVIRSGRRIVVRFFGSHRFARTLVEAHQRIQV